ncbi:MAG: hypothetical protein ACLTYN_01600 [Dysosmobacter welbionis]
MELTCHEGTNSTQRFEDATNPLNYVFPPTRWRMWPESAPPVPVSLGPRPCSQCWGRTRTPTGKDQGGQPAALVTLATVEAGGGSHLGTPPSPPGEEVVAELPILAGETSHGSPSERWSRCCDGLPWLTAVGALRP